MLLAEKRHVRTARNTPPLTDEQILRWADEHLQRTGEWPSATSGSLPDDRWEKWHNIDQALRMGLRGLPGGSSIAKFLAEHRGKRNRKQLPPYTEEQILAWADEHHERTHKWPSNKSGVIPGTNGETWTAVEMALSHGQRGLPGGTTLAQLLMDRRGADYHLNLPQFTEKQILIWIDAFHERTGKWPKASSGLIRDGWGDTWNAIDRALRSGHRGLPGGSSLARFLAQERGVRNKADLPPFSRKQILAWADDHFRSTGSWPNVRSGQLPGSDDDNWLSVDTALTNGTRGLKGGSSLAKLLAEKRGVRVHTLLAPLTYKLILSWADAHQQQTGQWPNLGSGAVVDAEGEDWYNIDNALRAGQRGLPGGSSLARLLSKKRGVRNPSDLPPLSIEEILGWIDAYHRANNKWPKYKDGSVVRSPGESWAGIDRCLREGRRGLPRGSSLARLLEEQRGVKRKRK